MCVITLFILNNNELSEKMNVNVLFSKEIYLKRGREKEKEREGYNFLLLEVQEKKKERKEKGERNE